MKPIGVIGDQNGDTQTELILEKAREMGHQTELINLSLFKDDKKTKRFGIFSKADKKLPSISVGIFCSYGPYDDSFSPTAIDFIFPELFELKHRNEIKRRVDIIRELEKTAYVVCSPDRTFSSEKDYLFLLESKGIKVPKTTITDNPQIAKNQIKELCEKQGKAVLKPSNGSLGIGVTFFSANEPNIDERIEHTVDSFFDPKYTGYFSTVPCKNYLVQEFIPNPKRKIRTLVIGHEPLTSAYYSCLGNAWKSANSERYPNRDDYRKPCKMNDEVKEISRKVSETLETDIIGIDVIEKINPQGKIEDYVVCDANSPSHWHGLIPVTDVDISRKIIEYALEHAKY